MKAFILFTFMVSCLVSIEQGYTFNTDEIIVAQKDALSRISGIKETFNDETLQAADKLSQLAELDKRDINRVGVGRKIKISIFKDVKKAQKAILNGRKASKYAKYAAMKDSKRNLFKAYLKDKKKTFGRAITNIAVKYERMYNKKQANKEAKKNLVKNGFKQKKSVLLK